MPDTPLPFAQAAQKLRAAKSVLIVLPDFHTLDMVAGGLALLAGLEADKTPENSKKITLACGQTVTGPAAELEGTDKIQTTIGSKNLVISLQIDQEKIEKVSYDSGNGEFNLIIETKADTKRLTDRDVRYSYRGIDADLIIAVGVTAPEQIGSLLTDGKDIFRDIDSVMISALPNPPTVGTVQLVNPEASSVSEIVTGWIRYLKLPIEATPATQLLAGIEQATNQYLLKTSADTFAAASFLMRNGALRRPPVALPQRPFNPNAGPTRPFSSPAASPFAPIPPSPFPRTPPPPPPPRSKLTAQVTDADSNAPAQDWLEPKIFRGGKNV